MNYLAAVDDWFLDTFGGMARVARDCALLMRDRGHRVAVFCARRPNDTVTAEAEEVDGIQLVRYARPELPRWHPLRGRRLIQSAARALHERLGRERWDIVHLHSPLTAAGVLRAIPAGPRCVYTMHSPVVLEQRINWGEQGLAGRLKMAVGQRVVERIERGALARCAAIQTLSCYTRDQIQKFYGLGDRVTVIPHWLRPEFQRKHSKSEARRLLGWPAEEKILFTVRRHGARYGLDTALNAIAPLAARGRCRFVVAGDGPLRATLERQAQELGASQRVTFPGRLSDEDLCRAYEAADLFVLPTAALECFGLIILEAFSFGCPVLSTDVGAIPETMMPIMPDFVVPARSVEALATKVEQFLDGRLVPPSGETLMRYVNDGYAREKIAPELTRLLEGDESVAP